MSYKGIEQRHPFLEPESSITEEMSSSDSETEDFERVRPKSRKIITEYIPKTTRRYKIPTGGALRNVTSENTMKHLARKPYTADKNGNFGAVKVNTRQLRAGNLVVTNHQGEELMSIMNLGQRVKHKNPCIYQLVMNNSVKCLTGGAYDEQEMQDSLEAFRQLVDISKLEPKKGVKLDFIYGEPETMRVFEFIPYSSGDDLMDELEVIQGSIGAGNTNNSILRKKAIAIMEEMLKIGALTEQQYQDMYDNVIGGMLI